MGNEPLGCDAEFSEQVDVEVGPTQRIDPVTDGACGTPVGHTNTAGVGIWRADGIERMADRQDERPSCSQDAMHLA